MRRAVALLTLALPAIVAAQTLNLNVNQTDRHAVSGSGCDSRITVAWELTGTSGLQNCAPLTFWVTTATACKDAPEGHPIDAAVGPTEDWLANPTGNFQFPVSDLPIFRSGTSSDGGTTTPAQCNVDAIQQEHRVCGALKYGGLAGCGSATLLRASDAPVVVYDNKPPPAPVLEDLVPLDGALLAVLDAPSSDAETIHLELREADGGVFRLVEDLPSSINSHRIPNLTNGVTYEVRAIGLDEVDNPSVPSNVLEGTPVVTWGFWARYQQSEGGEQGGCSSTGSALGLLGLGAAALVFGRRRWRRG